MFLSHQYSDRLKNLQTERIVKTSKNTTILAKKKKHTIKSQISVGTESKKIFSSATANGRQHDFKLFKNSKTNVNPENHILADSGYQGIKEQHQNSSTPKKNSKNKKLSKTDKLDNKILSTKRIIVENVFAQLKRFKILAEKIP